MATKTLEEILKELDRLADEAQSLFARVETSADLERIRVELLGKKSPLAGVMREMGGLSPEARPRVGSRANEIRAVLEAQINERSVALKARELEARIAADRIDVSLPGRRPKSVSPHPVQIVQDELVSILGAMGFVVEIGPEVEHEFYNFDALNIPAHHPSRAAQDTFYVSGSEDLVLRTHTSPVQPRTMLRQKPPLRMIAPGRVYRADYDATHSPMFHQVEALLVDRDITMADLKGTLSAMVREFFGMKLKVRLRPSFFPFTEPSAEIDIECCFCRGKGCRTCKNSGFIEIGGSGMVDPEVFKAVELDPEVYRGFAFGMGLERMAMLRFGIDDLRAFFESDHRFVSQFARWRV